MEERQTAEKKKGWTEVEVESRRGRRWGCFPCSRYKGTCRLLRRCRGMQVHGGAVRTDQSKYLGAANAILEYLVKVWPATACGYLTGRINRRATGQSALQPLILDLFFSSPPNSHRQLSLATQPIHIAACFVCILFPAPMFSGPHLLSRGTRTLICTVISPDTMLLCISTGSQMCLVFDPRQPFEVVDVPCLKKNSYTAACGTHKQSLLNGISGQTNLLPHQRIVRDRHDSSSKSSFRPPPVAPPPSPSFNPYR